MPRVRTLRPVVCLLLAVSVAAGTVLSSVRACACTLRASTPVAAAAPPPAPAPPCCPCCPPERHKLSCCCQDADAVPAPLSAGCACADCGGDRPVKLPDTPPAGGGAALDHLAALAEAVATPSALFVPAGSDRPVRLPPAGRHAPTDLVVVLSRLTI